MSGDTLNHRLNSFDLLRLLAASAVMISHSESAYSGIPDVVRWHTLIPLGDLGVCAFFAISGYLICGSLLRSDDMTAFTLRRACRLLPGLAVCVLFCAVVTVFFIRIPVQNYLLSPGLFRFLLNVLIFPLSLSPNEAMCAPAYGCNMVGPFWTLAYEVVCYALLALLFAFIKQREILRIATLCIAMFCFAAYIESLWRGMHDAQLMVWDISLFTMDSRSIGRLGGIFFVAASIKIDGRSAFTGWPAVIASLALFVAASWTNTVSVGIVTVLTVPSIVLALGNVPTRLASWISQNLGDISYGVYLYHLPLQVVVWIALLPRMGWSAVLIAYLLTIALAFLSSRLVERPALEWGRSGLSGTGFLAATSVS